MRRLLLLLSFFVSTAHAGTLIEPYSLQLRYGTARPHAEFAPFRRQLRRAPGLPIPRLHAGADYQTGRWVDSAKPKNDLTPSLLGNLRRYNLPILLRAYIVYIPFANLTRSTKSTSTRFDGGDAVKYGVGWTGLPFVSVQFEYVAAHYRALDTETYQVNVSLPINF